MIPLTKAFELIDSIETNELANECVRLVDSVGRVLAADVIADIDMPLFDKSSMDGFAIRKCDAGNHLSVIENIQAGSIPLKSIRKNECSKIMTGAVLPQGADCVVPKENVVLIDDNIIRVEKTDDRSFINYKGQDFAKGDFVLRAGTKLRVQHVSILASVGCVRPVVRKNIKIGVISTGNELVEPDVVPKDMQTRNVNASMLIAKLSSIGCEVDYYGIIGDDYQAVEESILRSTRQNVLTITTGGVSVGDWDFVPEVIRRNGFQIVFDKVAMKPGKPIILAKKNDSFIFCLSGNPVSSFIQFNILVIRFVEKLQKANQRDVSNDDALGGDWFACPMRFRLPIAVDFFTRKEDRLVFFPFRLINNEIYPIANNGSAHIHAFANADGVMAVEVGVEKIEKGELVDVRLF